MNTTWILSVAERQAAEGLRRELVDTIVAAFDAETRLTWQSILFGVPREIFVPAYYEQAGDDQWHEVSVHNAEQRQRWLSGVYRDETLIIQLADVPIPEPLGGGTDKMWTSSSTAPSLMVRMLHELELADRHRVLEIGTGSGYNAALLCSRVGDSNVTSVDISPELIDAARGHLAEIGHHPSLITGDGWDGYQPNAPYDRIIATCAVEAIPTAWLDQLATGGIVLTDWRRHIGGTIVKLRKDQDGLLTGKFVSDWAGFMYLRHTASVALPIGTAPPIADNDTHSDTTDVDPRLLLTDPSFVFLIQVYLRDCRLAQTFWRDTEEPAIRITAEDGSWCEVNCRPVHGRYELVNGGDRHLWRTVEQAHEWWERHQRPSWNQFGMTVTATDQWIWYDNPNSTEQWPIPTESTPHSNQ